MIIVAAAESPLAVTVPDPPTNPGTEKEPLVVLAVTVDDPLAAPLTAEDSRAEPVAPMVLTATTVKSGVLVVEGTLVVVVSFQESSPRCEPRSTSPRGFSSPRTFATP